MRAIIIEDKDAKALLDRLELDTLRGCGELSGIDPVLVERIHRHFHFIVCSWLQQQGCEVVR